MEPIKTIPTGIQLNSEHLNELKELFREVDISIIKEVIYFDSWSDYEEMSGIFIFRGIDESLQLVDFCYCVMAEDNTNRFQPSEIDEERAIQEIKDMEELIHRN